ncbi:hypothetical protein RA11412_1284 [Rothia aeria]|uniref:Uncharacterized protein n=1 Tax=Rothia aeria TaxID=172042 RepID=A0A2Z5QYZ5_9MICC|nr:hypothetical protein RA11412_1284 [Rothia aeria]
MVPILPGGCGAVAVFRYLMPAAQSVRWNRWLVGAGCCGAWA